MKDIIRKFQKLWEVKDINRKTNDLIQILRFSVRFVA